MQVWKFEQKIYDLEGVRLVIRAGSEARIDRYPYTRKATDSTMLTDWLNTRIYPLTNNLEVVVVNGRGETDPHGRTHMGTLRRSYSVE